MRDEERENGTPGGLNHRVRTPIRGQGGVQGGRVGTHQERKLWGQTAASELPLCHRRSP